MKKNNDLLAVFLGWLPTKKLVQDIDIALCEINEEKVNIWIDQEGVEQNTNFEEDFNLLMKVVKRMSELNFGYSDYLLSNYDQIVDAMWMADIKKMHSVLVELVSKWEGLSNDEYIEMYLADAEVNGLLDEAEERVRKMLESEIKIPNKKIIAKKLAN